MSINSFRPKKYEDFEIVDEEQRVVGHIRVKPSGILWSGSSGKRWRGVSLDEFRQFMEDRGKRQIK